MASFNNSHYLPFTCHHAVLSERFHFTASGCSLFSRSSLLVTLLWVCVVMNDGPFLTYCSWYRCHSHFRGPGSRCSCGFSLQQCHTRVSALCCRTNHKLLTAQCSICDHTWECRVRGLLWMMEKLGTAWLIREKCLIYFVPHGFGLTPHLSWLISPVDSN